MQCFFTKSYVFRRQQSDFSAEKSVLQRMFKISLSKLEGYPDCLFHLKVQDFTVIHICWQSTFRRKDVREFQPYSLSQKSIWQSKHLCAFRFSLAYVSRPCGLSEPWLSPTLCPGIYLHPSHVPGPDFSSLPQWCHSCAGPTALPCPAMVPAELGPPMSPCPGLASAHPCPHYSAQPSQGCVRPHFLSSGLILTPTLRVHL